MRGAHETSGARYVVCALCVVCARASSVCCVHETGACASCAVCPALCVCVLSVHVLVLSCSEANKSTPNECFSVPRLGRCLSTFDEYIIIAT